MPPHNSLDDQEANAAQRPTAQPLFDGRQASSGIREAELWISPHKVVRGLVLAAFVLAVASTIANLVARQIPEGTYRGLVEVLSRFDMDHEHNIPTCCTTLMLFTSAVLLAGITRLTISSGGRFVRHWAVLSAVFLYLAFDEASNLHEILIVPLRRIFHAHGLLYFAWVIPAMAFVAGFALAYARFLWHLDADSRRRFIVAGATYVGGALGLELLGGALAEAYGFESLAYLAMMTAEETCEMLGLALFIRALLCYLAIHFGDVRLCLKGR